MGLGNISGALYRIADKAADVAAGAIAEAVVAANGGVPKKIVGRIERESRPVLPAQVPVVENLTRILKEFAANTPDVDIRALIPGLPRQPRVANPRLRLA